MLLLNRLPILRRPLTITICILPGKKDGIKQLNFNIIIKRKIEYSIIYRFGIYQSEFRLRKLVRNWSTYYNFQYT